MTRPPPEERPAPRRVVVDTDVASFVFKRDTRRALYAPHLKGRILVISFQTVAEVERWALGRRWGVRRREEMEEHLARFTLLPYSRDLARWWAFASVGAQEAGRPIGAADA